MGLFDYLRCELPLPVGQEFLFQTKDTDTQYMMEHTIRSDGRLYLHDYETEVTPKPERPYPDAPEGSLHSMCGMMRAKEGTRTDVDQNFDGEVEFYPDVSHSGAEADSLCYRALFRGGQCVELCRHIDESWKKFWPPSRDMAADKEQANG